LEEGKEPVRPSLYDKESNSRFGSRKILPGIFPCNPQPQRERDDKVEDRLVKELGTTKDIFTEYKARSLSFVRF
jgi:hypothetical protein